MQAALDAANKLASNSDLDADASAMLAMEAMLVQETIREQGVDAQTRSKLHNSVAIDKITKKYWRLMQDQSQTLQLQQEIAAGAIPEQPMAEDAVTLDGYVAVHTRINKCIWRPPPNRGKKKGKKKSKKWNQEKAVLDAQFDWDADIARFNEDAGITGWFRTVQALFQKNAAENIKLHGWRQLFQMYDKDGDGTLDAAEFVAAARNDLRLTVDEIPDSELDRIFLAVGADQHSTLPSGSIDGVKFGSWIAAQDTSAASGYFAELVGKFVAASKQRVERLGWDMLFNKYDEDDSGGLDNLEFINAVRTECNVPPETLSNDELEELFCMIDEDGSSVISAEEFYTAVSADIQKKQMAYYCFKRSLFELADVWSNQVSESAYIAFLSQLFDGICLGLEQTGGLLAPRAAGGRGGKHRTAKYEVRELETVETMLQSDGKFRPDVMEQLTELAAQSSKELAAAAKEQGDSQAERGELDDALASYDDALELDPEDSAEAGLAKARLLDRMKELSLSGLREQMAELAKGQELDAGSGSGSGSVLSDSALESNAHSTLVSTAAGDGADECDLWNHQHSGALSSLLEETAGELQSSLDLDWAAGPDNQDSRSHEATIAHPSPNLPSRPKPTKQTATPLWQGVNGSYLRKHGGLTASANLKATPRLTRFQPVSRHHLVDPIELNGYIAPEGSSADQALAAELICPLDPRSWVSYSSVWTGGSSMEQQELAQWDPQHREWRTPRNGEAPKAGSVLSSTSVGCSGRRSLRGLRQMVSPRRQERLQQQQAIPMVHRGGGAFLTRPTPGKGRGGGGGDGTADGHRSLTARESSVANAISCSALTSSEASPRVTVRLPVLAGGGGGSSRRQRAADIAQPRH